MSGPRSEYQRRLAARREVVAAEDARSLRIAHWRLAAFTLLGVTVALAWYREDVALAWSLAPLLWFVALVILHERVERRHARAVLAVEHYLRALRRLSDEWRADGVVHRTHAEGEHPYAADLDLFGPASLFALLCTARTRGGEATLAAWLLRPAGLAEVRARQAAVLALQGRIDLREDLALLGGDVRTSVEPAALVAWGEAPPRLPVARLGQLRVVATVLAVAAVAAAVLAGTTELGLVPLLVVGLVEGLVVRSLRDATTRIAAATERPRHDLDVLALLLARLEREPAGDDRLADLAARMRSGSLGAAAAIARLARIVDWLEARRSGIFAPIAWFLMWELHGALAVERWRREHGAAISRWLAALGEYEALAALAGYAYERPDDVMPTLVERGPYLHGEDLRHPLLPGGVANSLTLGDPLRVVMVSGSNMSGKSTFLRTVGVNVVLALAGAPVAARSLTLSPLQPGATLRIEDSLQGASSRFYSELRRLRQLLDLALRASGPDLARAGAPPLLFLLDEIFHGTNSHDRRTGAEAVLRSLVDAGAIGLCTTHDLALARSITSLGERADNVHFQDEVVDDRLVFDYRVRPGIVRRSNAVALMRAVGLLDASWTPPTQDSPNPLD
jgi:hypothetical protein